MKYSLLKKSIVAFFTVLFLASSCFAQRHDIAITIDDLPFVGENKNFYLNRIIETLITNEVPATGFVIAGKVRTEHWALLRKFHEAGLSLGNHTLTHANLNRMGSAAYIQEIETADKILTPVLTEPKFFRYPYLATSNGHKREQVLHYLAEKNYQVAPITIDSRDFVFNQLLMSVPENQRRNFMQSLKPCYLDYIKQQTLRAELRSRLAKKPDETQILLVHANILNAYLLPDIINFYKENGYHFVSLASALNPRFKAEKIAIKEPEQQADFEKDSFIAWD